MKILMTLSNPFIHDLRVYYEAQSLVQAGHQINLVAWDRHSAYPPNEVIDNISVQRIQNNWVMQALWRKPFQLPIFWQRACKWTLHQEFDAVHCHDLDTLMIGIKIKSQRPVKLVFDAHEIFTYLIQRDLTRLFTRFYKNLEKKAATLVDHLIVADESYRPYFENIGYNCITSVLNTKPILSQHYQAPRNERFTLLYIGTLTRARFILELIEVVQTLPKIRLIIAGLGPLAHQVEERCRSVENITFLGAVPRDQVLPMTAKSDVVVCMIDPADENNRIASANKQFEAMVAGRPIIVTKGTRSGQITAEENCGLVIDFNKVALKSAILHLSDHPELCEQLGRNALKAALTKYNWEIDQKKLIEIYAE